jgi:hypothetical protein
MEQGSEQQAEQATWATSLVSSNVLRDTMHAVIATRQALVRRQAFANT